MSLKVPEQFRYQLPGRPSEPGERWGCFLIPAARGASHVPLRCIVSSGDNWDNERLPPPPWEHVSVSPQPPIRRTPTWYEMCLVKDLFWDEQDAVIQLHPPKSEYVNYSPHCLHLWRPVGVELVLPPSICVGPVKGDGGALGRPAYRDKVCKSHAYGCIRALADRGGPCLGGEECRVLIST